MLGSLGTVIFVASREQLRTFTGLQRSTTPRIAEHEIIGKPARPEFQARGLATVALSVRFDVLYKMQPMAECERLRGFCDTGAILPLAIGGNYWGDYVITSLTESHQRHNAKGDLLVAVADLQLKEVPT